MKTFRRPLLAPIRDVTGVAVRQAMQRDIRDLQRAPVRIPPTQVIVPVKKPSPMVTPAVAATSETFLYAFDWLIGADQPQSGVDAAVLRYDAGTWVLVEQPVVFFHVAGSASRPYQVSQGAGLSTANAVAHAGTDGTGWTETDEDDGTAFTFNCFDASGRWWKATIPVSGNTVTIQRSDAGDGSDWTTIDTIGNFYQLFGMAAHPTDPNMIAIGALDNDSDEPSMIITDDATNFSKFALPTTDFSLSEFGQGGFVGFLSTGRLVAAYQYYDSGSFARHVVIGYSDDPTNGGSYAESEVLSTYTTSDFVYRIVADIADDKIFVVTIREDSITGRPAIRIGVSVDNGATWAEVDNNGLEAPAIGVYNFDDYLFNPGGVRYFPTEDVLHLFGFPGADEPDSHIGGYQLALTPVDLAWKATTPLGTPGWTSQSAALRTLTGQDQPAFAHDAVSH